MVEGGWWNERTRIEGEDDDDCSGDTKTRLRDDDGVVRSETTMVVVMRFEGGKQEGVANNGDGRDCGGDGGVL